MGMNLSDIAIWWLVLEISGFVNLPLTSYLCRGLKDHGYCISKPLGLLFLTYITWIVSHEIGYSYKSIVISIFLIAALSSWIFIKKGFDHIDIRYIIKFEMIFLLAFLFFVLIRSYSPNIYWTGGEKFMDMTFINSILRTSAFPPQDPWMSGSTMYYYYFGYFIVSNLTMISGIMPSIVFNLATASFFALSFSAAFGAGFNLTEKFNFGLITAFFVNIAGNLAGFFQLIDILRKENAVNNIIYFNYWPGSRIIPGTINEFPYFSFLQGDLHPHMISITFQLMVIILVLNLIRSSLTIDLILVLGLSIGFLYPLNTWDYPVYLAIAIVTLVYIESIKYSSDQGKKSILNSFISIALMTASSYLLYLPYHLSYDLDKTISLVPSERTSIMFYIVIYGLFLFFIFVFILNKIKGINRRIYKYSLVFIMVASLIAMFESEYYLLDGIMNPRVNEFELMIVLIPLIVISMICLLKEKHRTDAFVLILALSGAFISIMCELFFIKDALGSGNPFYIRLNTIFKLYLQNWIIWSICAGYIVFRCRNYLISKKTLGAAALILIFMVSIFPVFATVGKSGGFTGTPDLDGEAYIKKEHPQDYAAILWFKNIKGYPVVLQAPGDLYQWNTVITTFTGLPTVIGWAGHELNWRFPEKKDIDMRWSEVRTIYTSGNVQDVERLLDKYNVSYVYFGEAETRKYINPELFENYPERFKKVFEYGDVRVFEIRKSNSNR